ncbi:MAG: hypothetical protein AAGI66_03565 [Cyanobacteria bacterium P01_H01_bin.74]
MATAPAFITLTINYFQRNNIVEAFVMGTLQSFYNIVTLPSRMKILKYRFMLENQKLNRIEQTLSSFDTMDVQGQKINRRY